jgi:uncharacterized protein (DUF1800 family)
MVNSDQIARKAGFGYSLSKNPISEEEWVNMSIDQIKHAKKYISDNRFEVIDSILKDTFPKEDYTRLTGMVKSEPGSIVYARTYKKRHRTLRDQGKIKESDRVWEKFLHKTPISMAAIRRTDYALNTNYDFLNRLWFFWINHFTVANENSAGPYIPQYQETLRKHMFGNFSDLVYKSITHAGMISYLDNGSSAGPNSKAVKKGWTDDGTNENLAREVMELFTVTTQRGFTQEDVNGMTNVLTGWKIQHWDGVYKVIFDKNYHEPRAQKVLGKKYSGSGSNAKNKLKRVVKDLCNDPYTAQHIAYKLCRHFISDEPSEKDVQDLANIYQKNGGDLSKVYVGLLNIIVKSNSRGQKFLNPELWLHQAYRTFDAPMLNTIERIETSLDTKSASGILRELGMLHGESVQPNGFPDTEEGWVSNEYMSRRIRLASYLSGFSTFKSDLISSIKKNGMTPDYLQRLGLTSDRANIIAQLSNERHKIAAVLCSPEFMRV